jgi:UBX domain-containing protein 7
MADIARKDEMISQFLAFTGSSDADKAMNYLEMSGNNVETAVGLYMEHEHGNTGGGGGRGDGNVDRSGASSAGFGGEDGIRAPDETRRMQLMEEEGGSMGASYQMMHDFMQEQLHSRSAFASPSTNRASINNRAILDRAIAAQAQGTDVSGYLEDAMMDEDDDEDEDYNEDSKEKEPARLSDMFSAPIHIMHTAGGFQGARTMAKDSKRWLLVNIQRDAEFASHALNRDVWRDELVENLIREGFIFWQQVRVSLARLIN